MPSGADAPSLPASDASAPRRRSRGGSRVQRRSAARAEGRDGRPGRGEGLWALLRGMRAGTGSVVESEGLGDFGEVPDVVHVEGGGGSGDNLRGAIGRRRHLLKCLEFDEEGRTTERHMSRHELIKVAEAAGPGKKTLYSRENVMGLAKQVGHGGRGGGKGETGGGEGMSGVGKRGKIGGGRGGVLRGGGTGAVLRGGVIRAPERKISTVVSSVTKAKGACNELNMRDIRQVDPAFTAKAALWVRGNALVVSLQSVRAIILHDRMFLFDPDNPQSAEPIRYIQLRLAEGTRNVEEVFVPFELRALEGILIYSCMSLEADFGSIEPALLKTLANLPTQITPRELEKLRHHEQRLNHFIARSKKVQNVLQSVLDEDEDMAAMYLTEKRKTPDLVRNPIDHDEAEMLLESYLQVVDDLTNRADLANRAIDDTENLIEIHLDTMQNQLLLVNLVLSIISTIFGFGTMVTSIFGMNLRLPSALSELPSSKFYFIGLSMMLAVALPFSLFAMLNWSQNQGLWRKHSGIRCGPRKQTDSASSPAVVAVRDRVDRILTRTKNRRRNATIGSRHLHVSTSDDPNDFVVPLDGESTSPAGKVHKN